MVDTKSTQELTRLSSDIPSFQMPALAAGIVHEIKNPLAAIHLHLQMLEASLLEVDDEDLQKKLANPAYHIHHGNVPVVETYGISFSLLLNLASVCNPDDKSVLWAFISQYAPEATPENALYLDHMTGYAVNYYNDFVKSKKDFLISDDKHKDLLKQISTMLSGLSGSETGEEIQNEIYAIGREDKYIRTSVLVGAVV